MLLHNAPNHDHWVFAYGSLMWNPGFDYAERCEARLIGAHRALCVYSYHYRGTPEAPGLVLGLEDGGACHGIAYRIEPQHWEQTYAYLTEREQVSGVYREAVKRIHMMDGSGRTAPALAYLAHQGHAQYAGALTREEQLHLVRRSHGRAGPNADYVISTVSELERLGIEEPDLNWITHRLRASPAHRRVEDEDAG
ncbi:gamma-glutamylcyclotransferase [Xanthobacter sp. TB0136]|uniref:gamma-glutamylcyclotransferase n=1 Tax=Xanthobacter sp. TB0136 TaxID=3459177 RepID=UPI004039712E